MHLTCNPAILFLCIYATPKLKSYVQKNLYANNYGNFINNKKKTVVFPSTGEWIVMMYLHNRTQTIKSNKPLYNTDESQKYSRNLEQAVTDIVQQFSDTSQTQTLSLSALPPLPSCLSFSSHTIAATALDITFISKAGENGKSSTRGICPPLIRFPLGNSLFGFHMFCQKQVIQ